MEAGTAILRFALDELRSAGRRMRHRMQRFPATGIYGDDQHRTLWDEWCFEVEHGPTDLLDSAWDHTLYGFANDIVVKTPEHLKTLLSWHLSSLQEDEAHDAIDESQLREAIIDAARELASGWD